MTIDAVPMLFRWALLALLCLVVVIFAWKIVRDLRRLLAARPAGERMWGDVAIVVGLILLGMFLGVGFGFKDLPLGGALRDLLGR